MIIHFLQIWLLVAVTFLVGCLIGAWLYGILADSSFALAQGAVADTIGDGLDRVKSAFGIGPSWRAEHLKSVARPLPSITTTDPADAVAHRGRLDRLLNPAPPALRERAEPAPAVLEQAPEAQFAGGDPARIQNAGAVADDGIVPRRPPGIAAPRYGLPDNLTRIRGIGYRNETALNKVGIFHFSQIAAWTPAEARWIGQYLAFPERIERDDWVGQAAILALGGDTGFEKAADRRRRRRRALQEGTAFEDEDESGEEPDDGGS